MDPKTEAQIIHDFHHSVCQKKNNQCVYWNSGCSHQKACHKLSSFRSRVKKEEREQREKEMLEERIRIANIPKLLKSEVELKLQSTQRLISLLERHADPIAKINPIIRFELRKAKEDLQELLK